MLTECDNSKSQQWRKKVITAINSHYYYLKFFY